MKPVYSRWEAWRPGRKGADEKAEGMVLAGPAEVLEQLRSDGYARGTVFQGDRVVARLDEEA